MLPFRVLRAVLRAVKPGTLNIGKFCLTPEGGLGRCSGGWIVICHQQPLSPWVSQPGSPVLGKQEPSSVISGFLRDVQRPTPIPLLVPNEPSGG